MTTRTVNVGVISYRRADMPTEHTALARLGEVIDVHPDDLARFDKGNRVLAPEPYVLDPDGRRKAPAELTVAELTDHARAYRIDLTGKTSHGDILAAVMAATH